MATPSTNFQRELGFFHASSKVQTLEGQYVFESNYSANHVTFLKDILSDTVPYLDTETGADAWIISNPGILKKYENYSLTNVDGSDGQAWYINEAGNWIKPIIVSALAPNQTTNSPSNGLVPKLYKNDGTRIYSTDGIWLVEPYQGMVLFQAGYTPSDMGYGIPKITCYAYIGDSAEDSISGIKDLAPLIEELRELTGILTGFNASQIDYDTVREDGLSFNDVEEALDALFYLPLECDFYVDGIPNNYYIEKGNIQDSLTLTWDYNYSQSNIIQQSINQGIGTVGTNLREYTHSGLALSSDITYTISTYTSKNQWSYTSNNIFFKNKKYIGMSSTVLLSSIEAYSFESDWALTKNFTGILTANQTNGGYIHILYPSSLGELSAIYVNGTKNNDFVLRQSTFYNQYSHPENYYFYRSNNLTYGSGIYIETY